MVAEFATWVEAPPPPKITGKEAAIILALIYLTLIM
jgi:hypothetical protein